MSLLKVRHLTKTFGALTAINDLSFTVGEGEVLGIMGPNGAGKSTLFGLIMGAIRPDRGSVTFAGRPITGLPTNAICRLGIGRTYQIPQPFRNMSVLENLMVGELYARGNASLPHAQEEAGRLLERVGLARFADEPAGRLGLLDLKRLELAKALSTRPKLLLLDEVAGGLVGSEVEALEEILADLKAQGQSMIVIEHVLRTLFTHSDRILVMNFGTKITEGRPQEIVNDPQVVDIYLGETHSPAPVAAKPATSGEPLLQARNVSAGYGAFQALFDVNLEVRKGEIVALLGINGAGKTTLTRALTRQLPLRSGEVFWKGENLARRQAHDVAELGIAQCLEGRKIFRHMTVRENLDIGAYPKHARADRDRTRAWVYDLFPRLKEREGQLGGTLSGGEQQMLAIGRALMAKPELVIFDEISLGLAPKIIDGIYDVIPKIAGSGMTVLLIEQNVHRSLAVADRAYILEHGRIAVSGDARALAQDPSVQHAYFGLETAASP